MNDLEFDVPKTWTITLFGDVSQIVSGGTPPSRDSRNFSDQAGIPWITPADLSGYKHMFISRGVRNLSENGLASCSATLVRKGSVLFSSRAPIGYVAIAANELTTSQGFKSFILPDEMDSRFVYYYLRRIKQIAEARATGTTFKEISGSGAAKLPLLIAPSNEQKRISDKLDRLLSRVDACRDRLNRLPNVLKQFREAVIAVATSGELTAEWRDKQSEVIWDRTTLGECCSKDRAITYGVIKLGDEIPAGIPCLRTSNVRWLRIDREGIKLIAPDLSESHSRTILAGGEVLVAVRGTLGGVAVTEPDMVGWNVSREVAVVPIDQRRANPSFIALCVASNESQKWLTSVQRGIAYTGINIEDLRDLPLKLPSIKEQVEIVRRVEILFAFTDGLDTRLQKGRDIVERIAPAVLDKAFRGELVTQDSHDEQSYILLQRLQATRRENALKEPIRRKKSMSKQSQISVKSAADLVEFLIQSGTTRKPSTIVQDAEIEIDDFYEFLREAVGMGWIEQPNPGPAEMELKVNSNAFRQTTNTEV